MNNLLTQKFPIAAFVLLFVLTLSCSHEPAVEPQEPGGTNVAEWNDSAFNGDAVMNQMAFCIGEGITVKRDAATRSTTDIDGVADFETGDLVAVAVTQGTSAEEIKLYRVKSDGSLEYAGTDNSPLIWKSATTPTTIRAWSYGTSTNLSYTLDAPESFDYSLTSNQQTNGYNELLYSKEAAISYATYSSSPIPLTFRHQLSRFVVNIEHDRTTTLTGTASMGDNVNNTFPITARFDTIGGGSWTPTAYGAITPKAETTQSGYEATYSAVVFPGTYAQNTKMFTLTNTDGDYVYAVSDASGQTLTAGNQYNYTILVKDDLCRRNPLWWVAQYNMASNRTSFVAAHSTSSQYVFLASTAATENVANYHLPSLYEYASIIPTDDEINTGTNVFKISNTLDSPYEYSEIPCNIGGKSIAGPTSYIGKKSSGDCYAIRFIGTPHASAWHYKWTNTPCNGLLIESYMLSKDMTVSEAQTLLANWKDNTPPNFTGTLGASGANLSPETTVISANGFVQRFFPAAGYTKSSNGTANQSVETTAYYWGSQITGSSSWTMLAANNEPFLGLQKTALVRGFPIRLFKDDYRCSGKSLASSEVGDIICAHGKAYSPTTGSLPCGKEKVAIVAYKGAAGTADTSTGSESYTGLALAVQDANGGATQCWYTSDGGACITSGRSDNIATAVGTGNDWMKGIDNTNRLYTSACGSGHYHAAAHDAVVYENTVPHPVGTSQWFLPTIAQWNLMVKAVSGDSSNLKYKTANSNFQAASFNRIFTAAGVTGVRTDYYWASVEYRTDLGWGIDFKTGTGDGWQKYHQPIYVRSVLAF